MKSERARITPEFYLDISEYVLKQHSPQFKPVSPLLAPVP